jgi:hypothetical protein
MQRHRLQQAIHHRSIRWNYAIRRSIQQIQHQQAMNRRR